MEAWKSPTAYSQTSSQAESPSNSQASPSSAAFASSLRSASDFQKPITTEENHSHTDKSSTSNPPFSSAPDSSRRKAPTRASTISEPKKCWICYSDSTEDDPSTSPWRSPCPCALTAHEACLLDWIADVENPKNKNHHNGKIECPQCKSEIKIARPRSFVVSGLQVLDSLATRAILPGLASLLVGTTWAGLWWHGLGSLYVVFGNEASTEILQHATEHKWWTPAGLPLIPVSLIASRTKYSRLVCHFATFFLLAVQTSDSFRLDTELWPPTAPGTFACLPVVQTAYNFVYKRAFGELNRRWLAEVQPRAQEDNENEGNDAVDGPEVEAGDVVVDFNIEFELGRRRDNEDNQQQGPPPGEENAEGNIQEIDHIFVPDDLAMHNPPPPPNEPLPFQHELNLQETDQLVPPPVQGQRAFEGAGAGAGPQLDQPRDEAPDQGANVDQAGPQNQNPNGNENGNGNHGLLQRRGEDLVLDSTSIAQTILGALVFPVVSRGVGQFLFYSLPSSLTTDAAKGVRPGLLQTRWGRTVVGGALFVVLKDMVTTYARWRIAKGHRQRRVVDFNPAERKDGRKEKK